MIFRLLEPLPARYAEWIFQGCLVTLLLGACVIVAACLLSLPVTAARMSRHRPMRGAARLYQSLFRKTPLLIQLFFWYFGAAQWFGPGFIGAVASWRGWHVFSFSIPPPSFEFLVSLFGLTLYSAAFLADEWRAGIRTIPRAQWHAAVALGMTRRQAFVHVVMPQAARVASLPALNQFANVIKNTSLAMGIGLAEMSYAARQVETESLLTFQSFASVTVLYVALIVAMQGMGGLLLKRMGWHRRFGRA